MLPVNFQFNQASLQDYVECPRRFHLRYLLQLVWPAIEAEPVEEQEQRMQLGVDFHRLVQRHLTGIPEEILLRSLTDDNITRWWRNYQVYRPYDHPGKTYVELTLTAPVSGYRILAKYDLLIVDPGKQVIILDWKTNQYLPRKATLKQRMQTKVYSCVCALAGKHLNDGMELNAENIKMIYWFTEYPESVMNFPYSSQQLNADLKEITAIIQEIETLQDTEFRLTTDTRRCAFCEYRSYCGTGELPGVIESYDDEANEESFIGDFNFDQIAEIEF